MEVRILAARLLIDELRKLLSELPPLSTYFAILEPIDRTPSIRNFKAGDQEHKKIINDLDFYPQGRVFAKELEVYWRRRDDGIFRVSTIIEDSGSLLKEEKFPKAYLGPDCQELSLERGKTRFYYLWGVKEGEVWKEGRIPIELRYPIEGKRIKLALIEYWKEGSSKTQPPHFQRFVTLEGEEDESV
ncbi:MAG TPA: hypothetical protein VHT73_16020 [Thermodesulfobacteriota bacterium]|nr:hypothetical protein [Thermodesulfobacteriota bacterium]